MSEPIKGEGEVNIATDAATEKDVALDILALLDAEPGNPFGSDETTIELVGEGESSSVVIKLDNGQQFRVVVREIR